MRRRGAKMGKKSTGPIEDDGTLSGYYAERQRRSHERNPTRSVGDDGPKKDAKNDTSGR
jgi:hypothetical protein